MANTKNSKRFRRTRSTRSRSRSHARPSIGKRKFIGGANPVIRIHSPDRNKSTILSPDHDKAAAFFQYAISQGRYATKVCTTLAPLACAVPSKLSGRLTDRSPEMQAEFAQFPNDLFFEIPRTYIHSLLECPFGLVISPLEFRFRNKGHVNLVIVNKQVTPWEIERFEPHGGFAQDDADFDLKDYFTRVLTVDREIEFTYRSPVDVCPKPGPQAIAERNREVAGFCQTWVLWYIDLKLTNPEMTSSEILHYVATLPSETLYEMIQDYVDLLSRTPIPKAFYEMILTKRAASSELDTTMRLIASAKRYSTEQHRRLERAMYTVIAKSEQVKNLSNIWLMIGLIGEALSCVNARPQQFDQVLDLLSSMVGKNLNDTIVMYFRRWTSTIVGGKDSPVTKWVFWQQRPTEILMREIVQATRDASSEQIIKPLTPVIPHAEPIKMPGSWPV